MDEKKDGRLDKAEFIKYFVPAMSRYFKPSIFKIYATGISLDHLPGYQAQPNSPFSNLHGPNGSSSPSSKQESSPTPKESSPHSVKGEATPTTTKDQTGTAGSPHSNGDNTR